MWETFANTALTALIARAENQAELDPETLARKACLIADKMMGEWGVRNGGGLIKPTQPESTGSEPPLGLMRFG